MPLMKVFLVALCLAWEARHVDAARGESKSRPSDIETRDLFVFGGDGRKNSKDPLGIFRTPAPSTSPTAAPTATFERFFEIDLDVDGDDASVLFNVQDDIASALIDGYNTLADDSVDPFNVRMTDAQLDDIIMVMDDGRRLRRTKETFDNDRYLQGTNNVTDTPRRRSRATASLTSRGICNGCPPTQRFTTSVVGTRRIVLRSLQTGGGITLDALLDEYNTQAEDISDLDEATGIREFDVPPTLSPTSAPSATPSGKPSSAPSPVPSVEPSASSVRPSSRPSAALSTRPSAAPSFEPSSKPSSKPSLTPSYHPSSAPSFEPTGSPSKAPTPAPTPSPTKSSSKKSRRRKMKGKSRQ